MILSAIQMLILYYKRRNYIHVDLHQQLLIVLLTGHTRWVLASTGDQRSSLFNLVVRLDKKRFLTIPHKLVDLCIKNNNGEKALDGTRKNKYDDVALLLGGNRSGTQWRNSVVAL